MDIWGAQKAHHQRSGAEEVPEVLTGAHWQSSHYEFLWGTRACVQTNKMKVLEVQAKIHDTLLTSFPELYD